MFMKKLIYLFSLCLLLASCGSNYEKGFINSFILYFP